MHTHRTIIVGDVHGCIDELNELLERLKIRPKTDRVIFIGDLINKGPASYEVYKRFKELQATSILGNHEFRVLRQVKHRAERDAPYRALKDSFGRKRFKKYLADIQKWPCFIEEDEFLVVHAGIVPDCPPKETDPGILVNIRTWDGVGKDLQNKTNPPWFDGYLGDRLVVFGHWAALGGIVRENVIGLDTGCVYGKELSALVLPDREIISVPAHKIYCPIR